MLDVFYFKIKSKNALGKEEKQRKERYVVDRRSRIKIFAF